jgi:hypothetical protein
MRFPAWLLKSTWIQNSSLELSICSTVLLLLMLLKSTWIQNSSLELSICSSIISSSYSSQGWLSFCSLFYCTSSLQMGRSTRSPMPSSSSLVALSCHSAADSNSAILSLTCGSVTFSDRLASTISSVGSALAAPQTRILLHLLLHASALQSSSTVQLPG